MSKLKAPAADLGPAPFISGSLEQKVGQRKFFLSINQNGDETFRSIHKHDFMDDVTKYLPPRSPTLTKAGYPKVHQPYTPPQTKSWWQAQCIFRGLPDSGGMMDLQNRVREHGSRGMGESVRQCYKLLKCRWLAENERAVENKWQTWTEEQRAQHWPKRYLQEPFFGPQTRVVYVAHSAAKMVEASQAMGLTCQMIPTAYMRSQQIAVVGTDAAPVQARAALVKKEQSSVEVAKPWNATKLMQQSRFSPRLLSPASEDRTSPSSEEESEPRPAKRLKKDFHDNKWLKPVGQSSSNVAIKYKPRFMETYEQAHAKGQKYLNKGTFGVRGSWIISCPEVEQNWGSVLGNGDLELSFQCTNVSDGLPSHGTEETFISAEFDLLVYTGILRLLNPNGKSRHDFVIPGKCFPSIKNQNFKFLWRGEDISEGQIELGSDKSECSIKFENLYTLTGIFRGGALGEEGVEFKGYRKFWDKNMAYRGTPLPFYPDEEWEKRSEAAWEQARVSRWH